MIHVPVASPDPRTRVLCVDDNPDIADSEALLLGLHGYDARPCYGGREALVVAETFQPRVCLLDFHMPVMGGAELAAGLRVLAGPRPLCLIAVTGATHLPDSAEGTRFDFCLFKPVAPHRLLAAIAGPAGLLKCFPGPVIGTARAATRPGA